MNLDFFTADGDAYYRTCEDFSERAYTDAEIEDALLKAGLKIEARFDDITENAPCETTERIVYVTRKVN